MTIAAYIIGAFYVFAGLVVLRTMAMDRLLDDAIAKLTLKPTEKDEKVKSFLLTLGGVLTFAGGVALAMLSIWALPLFAANVLVQGAYLLWALKYAKPENALEEKGRKQTINAFLLYCAAFVFVIVCRDEGVFAARWSFAGLPPRVPEALFILALTGFFVWYFLLRTKLARPSSSAPGWTGGPSAADDTYDRPIGAVRVAPEYGCWPLWHDEGGDCLHPNDLELSNDLARRILDWDERFQATLNNDDPASSKFATEEEEAAHFAEGRAIAEAIKAEWKGDVILSMNGVREHLLPPMRNIVVRPAYGYWPLYNRDTGNTLHPFDIGLSDEMFEAISDWNDVFQATWNKDAPDKSGFRTWEEQEAFENSGHEIVAMIRADQPEVVVVDEVVTDLAPDSAKSPKPA
jgi:hypothetical protein